MQISLFLPMLLAVIAYFVMKNKSENARLERVLNALLRDEASVNISKDLRVAVGFGSCMDIIVEGLPLFDKLGFQPPKEPAHHDVIKNEQQLAEAFVYFMREGAAAE